jgi:uncharacterized protein (TIGR03435 family)
MIAELTNHLWQSTLFAAAAGLITVALRRNQARIRYRVWMAASLKFFVPFAVLVAAGGHLSWHTAPIPVVTQPGFAHDVEEAAQPFVAPMAVAPAAKGTAADPILIIGIVWGGGIIAVLCHWMLRWSRMRSILRSSAPLDLSFPVPVRTCSALTEPGIYGVFRPVLLIPEGITAYLIPEQLQAILAHESSHIRRRDNLTSFLHMLVEAVFWFHPLVWWIGSRLVEERERACDEEVLQRGIEPLLYAESILNTCKLYVESPLACVSGATGADLKRRIEAIMARPFAFRLNFAKKAVLGVSMTAALIVPLTVGILNTNAIRAQLPAAAIKFEVASVKVNTSNDPPTSNFPLGPGDVYVRNGGYFSATAYPLSLYIAFAYKSIGNQGQYVEPQLPDWAKTERFDIQARTAGDPTKDQMRAMMQSLLAERFKLAVHYEDREVPVFAFMMVKNGKTGPQLHPHVQDFDCPTEQPSSSAPGVVNGAPAFCNGIYPLPPSVPGRFRFGGRNVTLGFIADTFSAGTQLGRPMIDQTGLSGRFDFTLEWVQDRRKPGQPGADVPADVSGPSFEEALREQLGIKLQPSKGPFRVMVIEHLERPTAN